MYKSDGYSVLDVLFNLDDIGEADTQLGYFRSIDEADQDTVTRIAAMEQQVEQLARQIDEDRADALEREMGLREQQAAIEDELPRASSSSPTSTRASRSCSRSRPGWTRTRRSAWPRPPAWTSPASTARRPRSPSSKRR